MTSNDNNSNSELLGKLAGLYSAVIADILDEMGHPQQVLPSDVRSLSGHEKIVGRIVTGRGKSVDSIPETPYRLQMEMIDKLEAGQVMVIDGEYNRNSGMWGELLTTASLFRGGAGVLMTACSRDIWKIRDLDFPVFGIGVNPADSKGRFELVELYQPIVIGDTRIETGDLLLGDVDGCVVIPE